MGQRQGIIGFEGLRVTCVVGVHAHERHLPQDILLDLKVRVDFSQSASSDQLVDTVDYSALAACCLSQAIEGHYQLLEAMADKILQELMMRFPIHWAWIRIRKPAALPAAICGFVELERSRS